MNIKEDIKIQEAIVHILDTNLSAPVFSDLCLELNSEIKEFIQGHIFRIISGDDSKKCSFTNTTSTVYSELINISTENFIDSSKRLAGHLYEIMHRNVEIPSADLMFILYSIDTNRYLAILKMDYRQSYIHFVEKEEEATSNKIIKHRTVLPSVTHKLDEAILLSFNDLSLRVVEKKYEIQGKKEYYLSKYFLECSWEFSTNAKISMINIAMEQVYKKYFENSIDKKVEFKKAIHDQYVDDGEININKVVDKVFDTEQEIQQEFKEKVNQYGLLDNSIIVQNDKSVKKYEKQLIKTDTGIEINVPMDQYNNSKILEFINNPDGTVSILIKSVAKLIG